MASSGGPGASGECAGGTAAQKRGCPAYQAPLRSGGGGPGGGDDRGHGQKKAPPFLKGDAGADRHGGRDAVRPVRRGGPVGGLYGPGDGERSVLQGQHQRRVHRGQHLPAGSLQLPGPVDAGHGEDGPSADALCPPRPVRGHAVQQAAERERGPKGNRRSAGAVRVFPDTKEPGAVTLSLVDLHAQISVPLGRVPQHGQEPLGHGGGGAGQDEPGWGADVRETIVEGVQIPAEIGGEGELPFQMIIHRFGGIQPGKIAQNKHGSFLPVEQGEAFVVVVSVVDEAVVGVDDALGPPGSLAHGADVALIVAAALFLGQKALVVAEVVPADGRALSKIFHLAAGPAQLLGLLLGDIVGRQLPEQVQIQGHAVLIVVILAVLNRAFGRLGGGGGSWPGSVGGLRRCRGRGGPGGLRQRRVGNGRLGQKHQLLRRGLGFGAGRLGGRGLRQQGQLGQVLLGGPGGAAC